MALRKVADHQFEGGAKVTGLPAPVDDTDATPKDYVDSVDAGLYGGLVAQAAVVGDLSAELDALPTLDTTDPDFVPVSTPDADPLVTYIDVSKVERRGVRIISSGTSATLLTSDRYILCTNVSATRTLTLPTAAAFGEGVLTIKIGDDSADASHYVQVNDAGGGDTMSNGILGHAAVLPFPYWKHDFISDGISNWTIDEVGLTSIGSAPTDGEIPSALAVKNYVDGTTQTVTSSPATVTATARQVACGVASGGLTLTLPAANAVPKNHAIYIFDSTGSCSATNGIDIVRAGSDTMTGGFGGHAFLSRPKSHLLMISDGVSNWTDLEARVSIDGTFASASDESLASALAIKTLVNAQRKVRTISTGTTGTIAATDRTVLVTDLDVTGARLLTMPTAAAFGQGVLRVQVGDDSASPTDLLTLQIDPGDTLIGGLGDYAFFPYPRWWHDFYSDGVDTWTIRAPEVSSDGTFASPNDYETPSTQATLTLVRAGDGRRAWTGASDYTILATDRFVALTTAVTADRTLTLPALASVPTGTTITITDESGSIGPTASTDYQVFIVGDSSEPVRNPLFPNASTDVINTAYDSRVLRAGATQWTVTDPGVRRPVYWYAHDKGVLTNSGVWTPVPWNSAVIDNADDHPGFTATTTLHSDMDGVALPQATIKVADTTGFLSAGWIEIVIGGLAAMVHYTGKTSTTFTGCNSSPWVGISAGTMATSQVVNQVYVEFSFQTSYLYNLIAGMSFAKNAVGFRDVRVAAAFSGGFPGFSDGTPQPALNIDNQHMQVTVQGVGGIGQGVGSSPASGIIEVYQNSGGILNTTVDGFATPIIMNAYAGGS